MPWLDPDELRVGLGCMRLTDAGVGRERALATIAAAAEAGITIFDTARAYGPSAAEAGQNERLVAHALRAAAKLDRVRVVSKGGMARRDAAWIPDGRARSLLADCEASLEALDGLGIDLYLLHAPDPRTPWATSLRALARLVDAGLVRRVGVANVNRPQLDTALDLAPISAVQVAISVVDDAALRGGLVARCAARGIEVIAHSPLGGPRRAAGLRRHAGLGAIAMRHLVSPQEAALAWLLDRSPNIVVIPGARRPETARSAALAASLRLDGADRAALSATQDAVRPRARPLRLGHDGDVVLVMGVPGAGKSRVAATYVDRGYDRLNRDARGGTLRDLAVALDASLAGGARRVVLDNTWLTRAQRNRVIVAAGNHGAGVRCLWLDTPLAQAQVNMVLRWLDRGGALPTPQELRSRAREPGMLSPVSQMRACRELEPPEVEEGFVSVERQPFVRADDSRMRGAVFIAAAAALHDGLAAVLSGTDAGAPALVFDWNPAGDDSALRAAAIRVASLRRDHVAAALCSHAAGPPRCWCRPPLPGLPLAFAREHDVNPSRSAVVGAGAAHRALATALGARYLAV